VGPAVVLVDPQYRGLPLLYNGSAMNHPTDHIGDLETMTRCLGFDTTLQLLRDWKDCIWQRNYPLIVESLQHLESASVLPAGLRASNIKEAGLRYLCFRTHFLRYQQAWEKYVTDLRGALAMAAAISGHHVILESASLCKDHGVLLDGTNLFLDPKLAEDGASLILDGANGLLRSSDAVEVCSRFNEKGVIVDPIEGSWFISLPYDGDFVTFFFETPSETEDIERRLVSHQGLVAHQLRLLSAAKDFLRTRYPPVWEFVREQVFYVNWTNVSQMESATDTRDPCSSVIINPRIEHLTSSMEQIAWVAHGLYHEAKHLQFFATYLGFVQPNLDEAKQGLARLSEPIPQIPCAWKGTPSGRSMGEHLLALQAFIPGLVIAFCTLQECQLLSQWIRDHIEMDMRAVNGAIGSLILGQEHLTEVGVLLSDIIRRDYARFLIPAYSDLDPQVRSQS
jgi:hypothetical protein